MNNKLEKSVVESIKLRKSVRNYEDKPLSKETIEKIENYINNIDNKKKKKIRIKLIEKDKLKSDIEVKEIKQKPKEHSISDAEVIVVAGRGVKSEKDLEIIKELADLLGGELAVTRPLIENGWADDNRQVGLSGRTVRPKLIITCGVSGAIQFVAGMNNADYIFAINKDEKAPIFKVAHYGVVGDIYEIVPKLIEKIKGEGVL